MWVIIHFPPSPIWKYCAAALNIGDVLLEQVQGLPGVPWPYEFKFSVLYDKVEEFIESVSCTDFSVIDSVFCN